MKKFLVLISILLLLMVTGCDVADTPDYLENEEESEEVTQDQTEEGQDDDEEGSEGVSTEQTAGDTTEADTEVAAEYTMASVATHNSKDSCWTVINGNVYDLTGWISKHPGGAGNILKICGIDGTAAFEGQHGGSNHAGSTLTEYFLAPLQ